MANTITTTTILDTQDRTIVKLDISGDGSGQETNTTIYDPADYTNSTVYTKLIRVWQSWSDLLGGTVRLNWDATAIKVLLSFSGGDSINFLDFSSFGGIINNGGAGQTGKILLTTTGLTATSVLTLILDIGKRKFSI